MNNLNVFISSPLDQPSINPNKPPLYSSMSIDESEPILAANSASVKATVTATATATITSYALNHPMQSIGMAQNAPTFTKSTQTTAIEMTSVGTQTDE